MARLVRGFGLGLALSLVAALFAQPALARPAVAGDDTTTVCKNTSETAKAGLDQFVKQLDTVSTQAQGGDLVGANQSVKQAGATLVATGKKLQEQGNNANDANLKKTVADLGTEFQTLGGGLTDLTGLQNFDTTKLEQFGTQMSQLCGFTPSPGGSFSAPSANPGSGSSTPGGGNPVPSGTG